MSLADHFAECPDCGGYIIEGTLQTGRTLSSMCRCPDEEEMLIGPVPGDPFGPGWSGSTPSRVSPSRPFGDHPYRKDKAA